MYGSSAFSAYGRAVARLRHRRLSLGCLPATPAVRAVRGEEGRRSYSLPSASANRDPTHLVATPFQRRGCGHPSDLLGPRGAFTGPCRPLTLSSSLAGTPQRPPCRPMRCRVTCPLRGMPPWIDLRARGSHSCPAGESLTCGDPRTPSVVSRTCEPKPTDRAHEEPNLIRTWTRAPFRLLSARAPRQAVLRASFWLAPWRSTRPCSLTEDKTRDASDRLLPPERTAFTRISRVPGSLPRLSPRGRLAESGLRAA
jgi:hypothetical protein